MIGVLPHHRLLAWALLIPITYAPLYLIGWHPGPAGLAVFASALALAALAVLRFTSGESLDRWAPRLERAAAPILAVAIVGYVAVAIAMAHARLMSFGNYDQAGLFNQSYWTLLRGRPFANTLETLDGSLGSHFGVHFSPTLLLIAPLYAVAPGPLTLLAAQAIAIALAVVPAYHLLKHETGGAAALVLALAFLALPNVFWGGLRDFRDASFLPVLLLTMLWALERRRPVVLVLAAIGALGLREEMGITLVMTGLWALLRGRGMRVAFGLAALGAVWMIVALRFVMPRFWSPGLWMDPARFFPDVLGQWGDTPLAAARAMLTHPAALARVLISGESFRYLYGLLSPLLLLPPLGDPVWMIALPGIGLNLLSRLGWMRASAHYYSLVPMTFLALAAFWTAARASRAVLAPRRPAFALALALVVLAGALPALPLTTQQFDPPAPPAAAARVLTKLIPTDAALYAPISLYPALGAREVFGCWDNLKELGRDPGMRARFEYVVLWLDPDPPGARDRPLADSLAADGRFEAIASHAPFLVFRRRAP